MCTSEDISDSLHGESLLCSLNEQRMQGFLCDVTIVVEDTKFKAHRNILAASSLYFRNHFRSQGILIQGHVLELNDLKADTFTEILNFIYSSKIAVKKKETLTDLVDAGKKLGITFLENIKASKKSTAVSFSTEPDRVAPPTFYRGENGLKSETVDKKGDDPAIANGPRITNAFSILETEVNGFSPLDLRANFKKSTGPTGEVHSGTNCDNGVCKDGEPVNTLAEHSYAVSSGDPPYKRDSVFDNGNKVTHTKDKECTTPGAVTTNKEAKSASSMPVLEPQGFTSQAVIQTCTSNSVSSSSEKNANQTEFYSQREDESTLPQLPPGNPPVTQPFCDTGLYPLPKKHHVTFNCKNCSKEFAHFKRLQRHEQICFKVVHMDRDLRIPNNLSQGASTDYCTSTESTTNQNALKNCSSSATDHFVKIVDDKIFYVCIVCKRNYLTLSSLRRHSNVHSWRKSYPCHYCNKVFALAEYRTKHEIWHTGDRRYQCIFCLETFMTYYILKNHQKSSHGIDPRLGVGNKANRGLKPSTYPYKLYRLLPMKCKRPPLKTPRTASATHFQVQNSFTTPTVVQNTVSSHPFGLNSQEVSSNTLDAPSQNVTSSTMTQDTWPFDITESDKNSTVPAGKANSPLHVSAPTVKQSCSAPNPLFNENQNIPSVINTSKSAPSVIMHSSRVSSVIMHGNAVTGTSATNGIGWNHSRTIVTPEKDASPESNTETNRSNTGVEPLHAYKNGDTREDAQEFSLPTSSSKNSKSVIREGNKTETYIAKPALPGTLVNSGIAPLCQITVKIGSEALVKRQISGSSLFFRKSKRPKHSESQKGWLDSDDEKKERCSIRLRRSDNLQMDEMCDDASDQDVSDKPWRPYYNYKPKKKSKHFKKFRKSKKRKKHSRLRSTEENVSEMDTKCSPGEAVDENSNGGEDSPDTLDVECPPEKTIEQEKDVDQEEEVEQETVATQWQLDAKACFCELCQKSFRNPSTLKVHMRCHTGEKPYSCKVCGKCFSFPGNLSKHERIHQVGKNFTCQYCKKTFLLHKTLEKHERIHAGEKMYDCKFCSEQFLHVSSRNNHEQKHLEEQSEKGFVCVQCSKVCKTAAALVMHQKKHYFRGLKHREHKDFHASATETGTWGDNSRTLRNDPKMTVEKSSVSMSESFPPSFDDCEAPLLSYSSGVTEVMPQGVASPAENVSAVGEPASSHFMTPPPLPPVALHSSVLMEVPKGWKHWKTRHYNLEENLNSDYSSLKESTKTFTELKTMTSFDNPFVP